MNATGLPEGQWLDVLRSGDASAYRSRSEAAAALALAFVNAGCTRADHADALSDPLNLACGWYRTDRKGRERRDWRDRIDRDFVKAAEYAAEHPRVTGSTEARQEIGLIITTREGAAWSGAAASSRLAILVHLHGLGTRYGTVTVRQSVAQVTEGARISRSTAVRHLGWLTEQGWLRVVAHPGVGTGTTYRLSTPDTRSYLSTPVGLQVSVVDSDALEVLRPAARRVLNLLHSTVGRTPADLLDHPSAPGRSAIHAALKSLAGAGLAVRADDGTWTRDLDGLADLEVEGAPRAEDRRTNNALRREGWRQYQEQRAEAARQRPRPAAAAQCPAQPAAASAARPRRVAPRTPTTTSPTTRTLEMAP